MIPNIEQLRQDVATRLAAHIQERNLRVFNAYRTAQAMTASWTDARCIMVYVLSNKPSEWMTLAQVARACGVSAKSVASMWKRLKGVTVELADKTEIPLFRRGEELRFRHTGNVDGVRINGGIRLFLQFQDRMNYREERTISETIAPAMETLTIAHGASAERQANDQDVTAEERAAATREHTRMLTGGASGPQLALSGTGTDGK